MPGQKQIDVTPRHQIRCDVPGLCSLMYSTIILTAWIGQNRTHDHRWLVEALLGFRVCTSNLHPGVVDSFDYYKGISSYSLTSTPRFTRTSTGYWSNNLLDTDKAYQNILYACAASPLCAFYTPNLTLSSIQKRVSSILNKLDRRPFPVLIPSANASMNGEYNYGILTSEIARRALLVALYNPRQDALPWFRALLAISKGDGREMFEIAQRVPGVTTERARSMVDLETAIACSDAPPLGDGVEEVMGFYEEMAKTSQFSDLWLKNAMCRCVVFFSSHNGMMKRQ
jgi:hypothetical protein